MHQYLVVSVTNRGTYATVGFVQKAAAEAYLSTVIGWPSTHDARLVLT